MKKKTIKKIVRKALAEDVGPSDITTLLTVPEDARCRATLRAKQAGVLSGIDLFKRVFVSLDAGMSGWEGLEDGAAFEEGATLATFEGASRPVLTGERSAMNFLQHLSGVATMSAAFVRAVDGLEVTICDTRKTTPLLREFEKEAVRHGGGANHRHALFDGILIKENHIAAAGGIAVAVKLALEGASHLMKVEVEVQNLDQLDQALEAGAQAVLLDNMDKASMARAVERVAGSDILLEASGNVTLDTVRSIAETGVHLISVGALTHSAPACDCSLTIDAL